MERRDENEPSMYQKRLTSVRVSTWRGRLTSVRRAIVSVNTPPRSPAGTDRRGPLVRPPLRTSNLHKSHLSLGPLKGYLGWVAHRGWFPPVLGKRHDQDLRVQRLARKKCCSEKYWKVDSLLCYRGKKLRDTSSSYVASSWRVILFEQTR